MGTIGRKPKGVSKPLFDSYPHLRTEWDYVKNIELDPKKLVGGSGKYAWWVCSSGHEWKTQIRVRASQGRGCGACHLAEQLRLAAINNPLSSEPDIASELDDPIYTLDELSRASTKKVWWKCSRGHRWRATPETRCYSKIGCRYCSGRLPIIGETDLATLRPDLLDEWDDDEVSPTEVTVSSSKKVKWRCSKGHQFSAIVSTKTFSRTKGNGCPYCSRGRYAKILVGDNDLETLHPKIAEELHSTDITAQELREYSSKKVEWKCSQGHIYTRTVADRVLGSGCLDCSTARTSRIEGRLRNLISTQDYLSNTVLDANHKLLVPWRERKSMIVDIYCEWRGTSMVVEYDGAYWHHSKSSIDKDVAKTNALLANEYIVIRIRENGLPLLEIDHPNLLQMNVEYLANEDDNLEEGLKKLEEWLNARA